MRRVLPRISYRKVVQLVDQLGAREKTRLARHLEAEPWGERLESLLGRIDARVRRRPIAAEEIRQEVEKVRQALYERRRS